VKPATCVRRLPDATMAVSELVNCMSTWPASWCVVFVIPLASLAINLTKKRGDYRFPSFISELGVVMVEFNLRLVYVTNRGRLKKRFCTAIMCCAALLLVMGS
jgi:hypothetical protein